MGSPQVEDGYTRIANELLDAILRFPFSKRELNVVLGIIRKTYGFNKTSDDMTGQQLADLTGIKRQHVHVVLNDLAARNVVLKRDGRYGQVIALNKKYGEWSHEPKRDMNQNSSLGSPKTVRSVVPKQDTQKTTPKDTTKRHGAQAPDSPKTVRGNSFTKPTLEEVTAYCQERGNRVDPEHWMDHYTSNGWKVGKNAMKDWKAAVRTWERNRSGGGNGSGQQGGTSRGKQVADELNRIAREDIEANGHAKALG